MEQSSIVSIDSKGYGKIYKIVMRDSELSLISKAIYAYLCSYAGSGTTAFPSRDKIMHDLHLSKNTYTKYLGELAGSGYISRIRTAAGNIYEIHTLLINKDGAIVEAKSKGYGTVPKLVMLDPTLTAQSKAIYAYLCSYSGSGIVAYPHRRTTLRELGMGLTAYYAHYSALVDAGYITPAQRIDEKGRFGSVEYRLNDFIGVNPSAGIAKEPNSSKQPAKDNAGFNVAQQASFDENYPQNVENSKYSTSPQTSISQEPISRDSVDWNARHANNNNNTYNKQILSTRVLEQVTPAHMREDETQQHPNTKREIKDAIEYDRIIKEIEAWVSLKDSMHHFVGDYDRSNHQERIVRLLNGLVIQLLYLLRRTAKVVMVNGRPYPREQLCAALRGLLSFQAMNELLFSLVDYLPEIRSIEAYAHKVLLSFAVEKLVNSKNTSQDSQLMVK